MAIRFPSLLGRTSQFQELKPTTQAFIAANRGRQRANLLPAHRYTITPYDCAVHGGDFLLHWWSMMREAGEGLRFGSPGSGPIAFAQTFAQLELVVVHIPEAGWMHGEGLLGVAWGEDSELGARVRLHYWTAPAYRHPRMTMQMGQAVLRHFFEEKGYQVVYGFTPTTNRLALWFARRIGMKSIGLLPNGDTDDPDGQGMRTVDALITRLTREEFRRGQKQDNIQPADS